MRNRDYVEYFIQGLPFRLKRLANEKKLDHNPTLEEPVILFAILKNYINMNLIANETRLKSSNDPDNKASPQVYKICKCSRRNVQSISRCFKRQTNQNRKTNLESRKQNEPQPAQSATRKCLKSFSGTTKIYRINELPITMSLHKNGVIETNPNLHIEKTLPDEIPLHMTNIIVKKQIGCTILTLDLLL